jgi:hypothetical protein
MSQGETAVPQSVPESVVEPSSGLVRFGVFDGEFQRVNLDQARLAWGGLRLPGPLARVRLKQWQHFALVLPDLFVGVAVVDAAYIKTSWCHVAHRTGDEAFEHRRMGVGLALRVARELWEDRTHCHARGYRIDVDNLLSRGEHRLEIGIEADHGRPAVRARLRCAHDLSAIQPLVVVLPVGKNRGMYSHKVALPLEGSVEVGDRTFTAAAGSSYAILDIHKAHYPRHTWWNWATFAGRDAAGRMVALNLTRNVNLDDTRHNENGLWLGGRLRHLGPAFFEFDPRQVHSPWRVGTRDGTVELTFTPAGERSENLRLGVMRSVFHQLHGTFSGTVRFDGEEVRIDSLFGLCEDHDSVW